MKGPGAALPLQVGPDFPRAEFLGSHVDIVQEKDSARPKFWQPRIDIVPHGRFGMKSIDVQNVDAAGLEPV